MFDMAAWRYSANVLSVNLILSYVCGACTLDQTKYSADSDFRSGMDFGSGDF